ncbi:MAG: DUF885 domain-containing protein [Candidatus Sericytochromatia bacterium]|nr:DUF885 domain-containing protein [Candidatus Sericytochromatia bacterium]
MTAIPTIRAEFQALVDRFHAERLRHHPTWGTALGRHEHDGALEAYTLDAQAAEVAGLRELRLAFEVLDEGALTPVEAHDRAWLLATISGAIDAATVDAPLERNPDVYASGLTESAFTLVNRDFAPAEQRLAALLSRMARMPAVLREAEANLTTPPQVYTELALEQLAGNRGFFEATVLEAFAGRVSGAAMRALREACAEVVEAFTRYERFLADALLPRSTGAFALGEDAFVRKLYHDELVELPLERLLALGEADLARNQAELRSLAGALAPGQPVREVLASLGREHVPPEALLATTRDMLDEIRAFIAERGLLTLPEAQPVRVVETPPFMRATVTAAMDTPGPFETVSTEAYYYMTLPSPHWPPEEQEAYMAQWTEAGISNLSVHEAYPGHYVQFLLLPRFPSVTRQIMWAPSNAEGWAHYCEQMMLEAGFQGNAPRPRIAMLTDALLRNARLVAGIKLHTQGMTVPEAQAFFEREAFLSWPGARVEAWRGTVDPTYGYYTLGKLMLLKLRADYAEQRGSGFCLREFHDAFLAQGPVPLPLVREALLGTREGLL